jgi:menaquinone-specific isochorismate synthase
MNASPRSRVDPRRGARAIEVRTEAAEGALDLLASIPGPASFIWLHRGAGLVAWGEHARIAIGGGRRRFEEAGERVAELFGRFVVEDEVEDFGTGPLAFGAFTFDAARPGSVMIVPSVVVARRGDRGWVTTIGDNHAPGIRPGPAERTEAARIRYAGSSISEMAWLQAVADAVEAVRRRRLRKVVLARDLEVWSKTELEPRLLARRLAARFPECFTFFCDGLIGATPELLVRRRGDQVESRVLAGSAARGGDPVVDEGLGRALLASAKDLDEHAPALESVTEVLSPMCSSLEVDTRPHLLQLANVQHLATEVRGRLKGRHSALEIAGRLHPTAAVCGAPTEDALALIAELEGLDRARYSGPVGWVSASGDGEWGIALRCAELAGARARLFAGAGIVAGSLPEAELEETRLKLRAMQSALEAGPARGDPAPR